MILTVAWALGGCVNLVKQSEGFYQKGEHLAALRVARAHLNDAERTDDDKKRLFNVLILSARAILVAPDTASKEEAFELFEAMPAGSDEKQKAAQRLLRVMARQADIKDLAPGLLALEPEMGEEAQVRSNLRLIAEQARGTEASLWAARTVVERWPDDADRWLDLASSHAALAHWTDAAAAATEAHARLHTFCAELPQRMAGYDKVRRLSAYGQFEIKRCQGFAPLALRFMAIGQQLKEVPTWATRNVEARNPTRTPCPAAKDAAPPKWDAATGVFLISPLPSQWWWDGEAQSGLAVPAASGKHVVTWKAEQGCLKHDVDVEAQSGVALRTLPLDVPADARPTR
jgi:hypothetical protein